MQFVNLEYELLKMSVKFTVEQTLKKTFALYDNYIRICIEIKKYCTKLNHFFVISKAVS